ncbi:MAG: PD-(D/E)XK nuclease domain-containing protein, partial [Lachnoclostridium sp.]|nr:PD-(D/E)XK nuclease domain-containing protein [Lachnoclostridium sp.]
FDEKIKMSNLSEFMNAILEKDTEKLMEELNIRLNNTISFYDTAENFYHGFLLGILSNIDNYIVKSNRESGVGRSDIFLKSTGIEKKAAIFECKVLKENDDAEEKCLEALQQINDKRYDAELIQLGYKEIIKYGIVFRGKQCMIIAG